MVRTNRSSRARRQFRACSLLGTLSGTISLLLLVVTAPSAVAVAPGAVPAARSSAAKRGLIAHYVAPVDAPVIDHFRPPACLWCSGNRGIDYGTAAGIPVHAAAGGRVSFAGQVGGDLFVVVTHPDGLRTTYGFLGSISVIVGDAMVQGQVVGTTGGPLHFGVRRGDVYLDPELLLAGATMRAHLVPSDGGPARVI
jgi:murein DD-endopeptidase MepM/ murein hydrolase activator NlpD